MDIDKINHLISKQQQCDSHLEIYQGGKKIILQFRQLTPYILRVLSFFQHKNISRGDKIGIAGTNTLEWVVIDLACISAGVTSVPFDPAVSYDTDELISSFELRLFLSNIEAYKNDPGVYTFAEVCHEQVMDAAVAIQPARYQSTDILTYKFTSGSTQRPKVMGAMKQSVDAAITHVQQIFQHGPGDRIMVFLPLHTYQQRYWIYSAILFDVDLILVPKEYVFHAIKVDRPTVIMGVPFFFETIRKNFLADMEIDGPMSPEMAKKAFQQQMGGQIRYLWTGSAPVGADTLSFYESMQMPLFQGYGMNEVCIVSKNYFGHNKTGSVGKLLPGKKVKFDEYNQLLVKSDYPVNTSYYNASEEDNNTTFLDDGYVATGDLGYMDADGFLFINGRIKELIVLANAVKIHPAPVEKKIETSPIIKHCLVYGDDHPYLVALIIPESSDAGHAAIKAEIARMNELLKPQEKICNFLISNEDFATTGRLSAQNKILRSNIIKEYKPALDELYGN